MTETDEPQDPQSDDIQPDQEVFNPDPADRYSATVTSNRKTFMTAQFSNSENVLVPMRNFKKVIGDHYCQKYVPIGTALAVNIHRMESDRPERNTAQYVAVAAEVLVESDAKLPTTEEGTITKWDEGGYFGFVARTCGCDILCRVTDRIQIFLRPGDRVRFQTVQARDGRWAGLQPEIITAKAEEKS